MSPADLAAARQRARERIRVTQLESGIPVRALRERLGLSQRQFAERIGCSTVCVRFWEYGKRQPSGLARRALQDLAAECDAVTGFQSRRWCAKVKL